MGSRFYTFGRAADGDGGRNVDGIERCGRAESRATSLYPCYGVQGYGKRKGSLTRVFFSCLIWSGRISINRSVTRCHVAPP